MILLKKNNILFLIRDSLDSLSAHSVLIGCLPKISTKGRASPLSTAIHFFRFLLPDLSSVFLLPEIRFPVRKETNVSLERAPRLMVPAPAPVQPRQGIPFNSKQLQNCHSFVRCPVHSSHFSETEVTIVYIGLCSQPFGHPPPLSCLLLLLHNQLTHPLPLLSLSSCPLH